MARPITAELVLTGYMRGAFPMCEPVTGRIDWYTCDPRALVPLDARFRVPRSLQRTVRGGRFEIRVDTAFDRVVESCASDRGADNRNWIGPEIRRVYGELHAMGFAHSVARAAYDLLWLQSYFTAGPKEVRAWTVHK
ncbi:MAG: hypothetical protein ACKOTD_05805, partial [Phycisphaerales bacterium]